MIDQKQDRIEMVMYTIAKDQVSTLNSFMTVKSEIFERD
jgi:hypothetical protein